MNTTHWGVVLGEQNWKIWKSYTKNSNSLFSELIRWSTGFSLSLQHIVQHLEETIASHKVVVNQIDEVVGVGDVLDKLLRCGAWFVQLGPVCVPQSKRFILCVGVWWAVCVISWCRQDSNDIYTITTQSTRQNGQFGHESNRWSTNS